MSRKKSKFKQHTLKLKDSHSWKAPSNHNVVVLDAGAVRFNIPDDWTVEPKPNALELYDKKPPADDCRLTVSYLRLPPVDLSELPVSKMMEVAIQDEESKSQPFGELVKVPRSDIEVMWQEVFYTDKVEHREARTRVAIARGYNLQALFTMDFWPEDSPRLEPVWKEVMRSIELGRYISDPTKGDMLH